MRVRIGETLNCSGEEQRRERQRGDVPIRGVGDDNYIYFHVQGDTDEDAGWLARELVRRWNAEEVERRSDTDRRKS